VTSITCNPPFVPYANFSIPLDTGECSTASLNIPSLLQQYHVINGNNPWVPNVTLPLTGLYIKYISFWWWGANRTMVAPNNTFIPFANFTSTTTGQPLELGIKNNMPCISRSRCFHLSNETSETSPHHFLLTWAGNAVTTAGNFRVYKDGHMIFMTDSTTLSLAPLIGNTPYISTSIPTAQYAHSQIFDLRIYTALSTSSTFVTQIQTEYDAAKLFGCGPSRGMGHGCILPNPVVTASVYQQLDYRYIGFPSYLTSGASKYDIYVNREINVNANNKYKLPGFNILSSINSYPARFILSFAVRRTMGRGASGSVNPLVLWFRSTAIQGMLAVADYRPSATGTSIIVSPMTSTSTTSCRVAWRRTNTAVLTDSTKWEMYHVLVNLSLASTWNIWQSGPGSGFGIGGPWGTTTFPTSLGTVTYSASNYPGADLNGIWVHSSVGFLSVHPIQSSQLFIPNPANFLQDLYRATAGGLTSSASWYPPVGPLISTALTTAGYFKPPSACAGHCTLFVSLFNATQTRAVIIPNSNLADGISKVCHALSYNTSSACSVTCTATDFSNVYKLCVTGQPCLCGSPRIVAPDGRSCICPSETTQFGAQCMNCSCVPPAICNSGVGGNGSCSCPTPLVLGLDQQRCQCPSETTQFGPNCTACSCQAPAICNAGFLGNGTCSCPSNQFLVPETNKTCECKDTLNSFGPLCTKCNCAGGFCNSTINGNGSCFCPGNKVYSPQLGCTCINATMTYSDLCLPCDCGNHPAVTCDSNSGACSCQNGMYYMNNGCHCPDGFNFNSTLNTCVSNYSKHYTLNVYTHKTIICKLHCLYLYNALTLVIHLTNLRSL
jgi:hypothetical protein